MRSDVLVKMELLDQKHGERSNCQIVTPISTGRNREMLQLQSFQQCNLWIHISKDCDWDLILNDFYVSQEIRHKVLRIG